MTVDLKARQPPDAIDIGDIVDGRYRVEERIGIGGFATIFKAHQAQIDRPVALKVLHAGSGLHRDPAFRARFEREARLAAQIRHEAVVTIYEIGVAGPHEQPYIAMELLEGYDAAFMLAHEGRFDVTRAFELLLPCIDALGRGHTLGIVHKDLKPANLFLANPGTKRERMKLLDFGIAREASPGSARITNKGEVLGTAEYLAPEYIQEGIVSPALDVYQMGLILGEMLTGEPIVGEGDPVTLAIRHTKGIELPPELAATPLRDLLERACAVDPAQRPEDGSALHAELSRIDPEAVEDALHREEVRRRPALARPDTVPATPFVDEDGSFGFKPVDPAALGLDSSDDVVAVGNIDPVIGEPGPAEHQDSHDGAATPAPAPTLVDERDGDTDTSSAATRPDFGPRPVRSLALSIGAVVAVIVAVVVVLVLAL